MRSTHRSVRKQSISLYAHTVDLPLEEKLSYGGALVSAIATLLPWFSFSDGNAYNGLQNVTWLIGYSILALSLLVLVPWVTALFNARIPQILTRQSLHWSITGGLIVLLSLIALSVYGSFEWIAIRSSIHFGLYVALLGGVVILFSALLNRSKSRRHHPHLSRMDRSAAVPDEEIERYLRKDPSALHPVEEQPVMEDPLPEPEPKTLPTKGLDREKRDHPPAMFDL